MPHEEEVGSQPDAENVVGALGTSSGWMAMLALALLVVTLTGLITVVIWHCRRRRRAGCIPLRVEPGGRLSLMLIKSRKHPKWWTFPAGGVDRGERQTDAATRETREEAGLVGRLGRFVCSVADDKSVTAMYALHVEAELDDWPEASERERGWFDLGAPGSPTASASFERVRQILSPKILQHRILSACERLHAELQRDGEQCERQWCPPPQSLRQRKTAAKEPTKAAL